MKNKLNINITSDDYNTNDFLYCWEEFGTRPNRIVIHNTYATKLFNTIIDELILEQNIFTEVITGEVDIINDKLLLKINESVYLSYVVVDRDLDDSIIDDLSFFYKTEEDSNFIKDLLDSLDQSVLNYEDNINNLNTLVLNQNFLELEPIAQNTSIDDINMFYNKSTLKSVDKLIKSIKKSDKGISILYGERGTGKTSIINYLSEKLNRIIIYIPNNMLESTINHPDFSKFLKKYDKPIIILDDCEITLNEIYNRTNILTNNILQMIDGFTSDSLNLNIITIFNTEDEDEIDSNLLDCNNLLDCIEFELLSEDESNNLATHLKSTKKYKSDTRLIDVVKKRSVETFQPIGL